MILQANKNGLNKIIVALSVIRVSWRIKMLNGPGMRIELRCMVYIIGLKAHTLDTKKASKNKMKKSYIWYLCWCGSVPDNLKLHTASGIDTISDHKIIDNNFITFWKICFFKWSRDCSLTRNNMIWPVITDDNTHDEKRLCKSWYIVSDSRSSTARVEVAYCSTGSATVISMV